MHWQLRAGWLLSKGLLFGGLWFGLGSLAVIAAPQDPNGVQFLNDRPGDDFSAQEEFRQKYLLAPNAQVTVNNINGWVDIGISDTPTAEVYIVRSARRTEDLAFSQVKVTATSSSLVIQSVNDNQYRNRRPEIRERITLKLPRQVALVTSSVNGNVRIGAMAGSLRIDDINGKVTINQATGYAQIAGINGNVTLNLEQLNPQGLRVRGINGKVTLLFKASLNADLEVRGLNGKVLSDLPDVKINSLDEDDNTVQVRLGRGGIPIQISGVNGSVQLARP